MILRTFRARTLAVAAVGGLTLAGTALAAHPNASKKYGGPTSAAKVNGFTPQVTFKVAKDGKSLQNFTYQSTGCFGSGGKYQKGVNYLNQARNEYKLRTVAVANNGSFSKRHVITTYVAGAQKITTISTLTGSFKNSKTAAGTIRFSQSVSGQGAPMIKPCSGKITFTATQAKPASGGGITGGY